MHFCTERHSTELYHDKKVDSDSHVVAVLSPGCTGLEELLGIEPALLEFQDTLFSLGSVTLERSVQSREVNEKLDKSISLFLTRLCPYFLLKPAHKCIEWLVHRYVHLVWRTVHAPVYLLHFMMMMMMMMSCLFCSFHIQLYNTDSLLACALPYHDTNMFVRVLQLLNIKDASSRWNWLQCLQVCLWFWVWFWFWLIKCVSFIMRWWWCFRNRACRYPRRL